MSGIETLDTVPELRMSWEIATYNALINNEYILALNSTCLYAFIKVIPSIGSHSEAFAHHNGPPTTVPQGAISSIESPLLTYNPLTHIL